MTNSRRTSVLVALRRSIRSSELSLIGLAIVIGVAAGLSTLLLSATAHFLQSAIYGLKDEHLSSVSRVSPWSLLALPAGGLALVYLTRRLRPRTGTPIDVVEANALHGGIIPVRDSLFVSAQTLISNGSGASVGLEAAYAQLGGGFASVMGKWLRLRRNDLRIMVGAGAGAAVGAAFGAPLTGAFYAFEIVIGAYTPVAIAPVAVAALAATIVIRESGAPLYLIALPSAHAIHTIDYFLFGALGLICALLGVLLIQVVTRVEIAVRSTSIPDAWRPVVGGLILMPIAWLSPQSLSAGHGALHLDLTVKVGLITLISVFALKVLASAVSLGFGFRGGLFFASLFLGALAGQIFSGLIGLVPGAIPVDATDAALIGMAAMGVAVVGGPMTMSMLVLESTHDFALTAVALTAALTASTLARETFGFSFSTWRLHTRGETIRSARDIGWIRSLSAGKLMQRGTATVFPDTTIAEFRRRFPLGATSRVVLAAPNDAYYGIVETAAAYGPDVDEKLPVSSLAQLTDFTLSPDDDVGAVLRAFEREEANDLAVLDETGHFLGIVTENYVRRRHAEEVGKAYRDLFGE